VLAGLDDPHRVVLVTSSVPGEGKTTVATNLAIALGQLEKVLLVDGDMRRASVGTKFGLAGDAPGLSNLVAGTAAVEECIHEIADAGIDIMPAGVIPPNPLELLSSHRFAETIERLGQHYGRIVIDSAPAQAVSDALVLSKLCNAVVFVVKTDDTPTPVVELAVRRLRQVDAHLVGAVLNRFDSEKASKYGYYGRNRHYSYAYQGYSQYYGDRSGS
jgi:capsular exopolysaccharide synthesis family protein